MDRLFSIKTTQIVYFLEKLADVLADVTRKSGSKAMAELKYP